MGPENYRKNKHTGDYATAGVAATAATTRAISSSSNNNSERQKDVDLDSVMSSLCDKLYRSCVNNTRHKSL